MDIPQMLLVFSSAGVSLKAADTYGEAGTNLKAYVASAVSATLFWLLLRENAYSSTFMTAVVVGSIASLKVNRLNLIFGLILLAALSAVLGFSYPVLWLLAVFSSSAFLDEFLHDRLGKRGRGFNKFFRYRGFFKVMAAAVGIVGWVPLLSAVGFLLFDACYDTTDVYLGRRGLGKHDFKHEVGGCS